MHWILASAIELNDGRRRKALVALSQTLGVHYDTLRKWVRGDRPVPTPVAAAIRSMTELRRLRLAFEDVRRIVDGTPKVSG